VLATAIKNLYSNFQRGHKTWVYMVYLKSRSFQHNSVLSSLPHGCD